ncbi:hypothetical protein MKEN_00986900 [Mycena kentingensis (nom. inval.)]|nr:hypothetical protein MKEN_00986900 [Mycena kentingensis (nom. inval.)]
MPNAPIHPCFQDQAVTRLPLTYRRLARSNDPRAPDAILDIIRSERLTPTQELGFLPLVYRCLDPATIPTSFEIDNVGLGVRVRLHTIAGALSLLVDMEKMPGDAVPEIWPRVWPWFCFIQEHGVLHPKRGPASEAQCFKRFAFYFIGKRDLSESMYQTLLSTPGFPKLVTMCADSAFDDAELPGEIDLALEEIPPFLGCLQVKPGSSMLAEIVEVAGGSLQDLGRLITKFFSVVSLQGHEEAAPIVAYQLIELISDVEGVLLRTPDWLDAVPGPLFNSLGTYDFVRPLIRVMSVILQLDITKRQNSSERDFVTKALRRCLILLHRLLIVNMGRATFSSALEAGLIPLVMRCATSRWAEEIHAPYIEPLFHWIIPAGFPFHSAILPMKLLTPPAEATQPAFLRSLAYENWLSFLQRGRPYAAVAASGCPEKRVCDNCGNAFPRDSVRRCSGCLTLHYCSTMCQKTDWRNGHLGLCSAYRDTKVVLSSKTPFHQRAYLRALADYELKTNLPEICNAQFAFLRANPFVRVFVTVIPLPRGPRERAKTIRVESAAATPLGVLSTGRDRAVWNDLLDRTVKSAGKMHMHVLQLPGEDVVVPLHTSDDKLFRGVQALAGRVGLELGADSNGEEEIRRLVESLDDASRGLH